MRDTKPDRTDAYDLLRDDDPRAIADLDHACLRAIEIAVDDLGTEEIGELLDVDRALRRLRAEHRGRLYRLRADRGVACGFRCFLFG